jgi:hypothetical protein
VPVLAEEALASVALVMIPMLSMKKTPVSQEERDAICYPRP